MGLITKPPSWAHCTSNLSGTPSTTVQGTNITAGLNDGNGASVAILSNLTHDVEFLVIAVQGFAQSTGNGSCLMDVLIDPAGGTTWASDPLINDLLVGCTQTQATTTPFPLYYFFPIWLKSGHSIGVRAQTAHTADVTTGRVLMWAYGGGR